MTLSEANWIVPGLVPTEGLTIIDGKPKSGKSTLALGIAMATAQGRPFANDERFVDGCLVDQPSPVLYVGTDGRWKHELNQRKAHYPSANRANLYVLDGRGAGLTFSTGEGEGLEATMSRWHGLLEKCQLHGVRMVVFDHLLKIAGARGVNKDSDVSPVLEVLDNFASAGISPVLLHHQSVHRMSSSKTGGMGHTIIHASMRAGLSVGDARKGGVSQAVTVTTNEAATMRLTLKPLRGEPPEVLNFCETSAARTERTKREKKPKTDMAIARTKAILDGPESARVNQAEAGRHLQRQGETVMGNATDGRGLVKSLLEKGLLATDTRSRLVAGPNWHH